MYYYYQQNGKSRYSSLFAEISYLVHDIVVPIPLSPMNVMMSNFTPINLISFFKYY
jgi:hypothetical protein